MQGVQVLHQVLLGVRLVAVDVNQIGTASSRKEVFFQGCVFGHEEGTHVHDGIVDRAGIGHLGEVLVPTRVVGQDLVRGHGVAVGILVQGSVIPCRTLIRTGTEIVHLVDGVLQFLAIGHGPVVIVAGDVLIVDGNREIVEDAAENLGLAVAAQHLCHVARGHHHVLHLMDVAVLAGNVATDDAVVEDVGRALGEGTTREDGKVALVAQGRDAVLQHVLSCEVYHHGARAVAHEVNALVVELRPVLVVLGHARSTAHVLDGVDQAQVRGMLHGIALHRLSRAVTHVR